MRALTVRLRRKMSVHPTSKFSGGSFGAAAQVDRDEASAGAHFAGKTMMRFTVERAIRADIAQTDQPRRLLQHRLEKRRIVARPEPDCGAQDQMSSVMRNNRQLRPATPALTTAGPLQKVAADMTAFEPCGVDGDGGVGFDQLKTLGFCNQGGKEGFEVCFFKRRFSA